MAREPDARAEKAWDGPTSAAGGYGQRQQMERSGERCDPGGAWTTPRSCVTPFPMYRAVPDDRYRPEGRGGCPPRPVPASGPWAGVAEDVQAAVAVAGQDQPLTVGGLVELDTPEV